MRFFIAISPLSVFISTDFISFIATSPLSSSKCAELSLLIAISPLSLLKLRFIFSKSAMAKSPESL